MKSETVTSMCEIDYIFNRCKSVTGPTYAKKLFNLFAPKVTESMEPELFITLYFVPKNI